MALPTHHIYHRKTHVTVGSPGTPEDLGYAQIEIVDLSMGKQVDFAAWETDLYDPARAELKGMVILCNSTGLIESRFARWH